jgi:hypothetical protein
MLRFSGSYYRKQPQTTVEFQHLWKVMDDIQALGITDANQYNSIIASLTGYVQSVTGPIVDNTNPQNPVVSVAVDGVTITGDGSTGNPLVAAGASGFTYSRTLVNTTPYSITPTSGYNVYYVDATAGAIVIDFPTAIANAAWYIIKKIDSSSNTVTLNPNGAETIDGLSTQVIRFQNTSIDVYSDNSNLLIA